MKEVFWDADAIYDKKKVVLEITTKQHWQKNTGLKYALGENHPLI